MFLLPIATKFLARYHCKTKDNGCCKNTVLLCRYRYGQVANQPGCEHTFKQKFSTPYIIIPIPTNFKIYINKFYKNIYVFLRNNGTH